MLAEERFREIQKYVESHGTVTVQELTDLLNTSESTVRRDLTELHKRGTLIKVHGGATTVGTSVRTRDEELSVRQNTVRDTVTVGVIIVYHSIMKIDHIIRISNVKHIFLSLILE